MNQCPACHTVFPPDDVFCPNDGATLTVHSAADAGRVVISWDDEPRYEVPTQVVQTPRSSTGNGTPAWMYAFTGALAATALMGGAILFYQMSRDQPIEPQRTASGNAPSNVPPATTNSVQNSAHAAQSAANAVANAANAMANAANTAANAPLPPRYAPPRPSARQFSETYVGNVGDNGVEMDLRRSGTTLTGTVRPYGNSADIYVNGYIDDDGSFSMDETSDIGVVTGVYRGWLHSDGTINGSWAKPGGDRSRSISLRRR